MNGDDGWGTAWLGSNAIYLATAFDDRRHHRAWLWALDAVNEDNAWRESWRQAPRPRLLLQPYFEDQLHRNELSAMPEAERASWSSPKPRVSRAKSEVRVRRTFDIEHTRAMTLSQARLEEDCRGALVVMLKHAWAVLALPTMPPLPWSWVAKGDAS